MIFHFLKKAPKKGGTHENMWSREPQQKSKKNNNSQHICTKGFRQPPCEHTREESKLLINSTLAVLHNKYEKRSVINLQPGAGLSVNTETRKTLKGRNRF